MRATSTPAAAAGFVLPSLRIYLFHVAQSHVTSGFHAVPTFAVIEVVVFFEHKPLFRNVAPLK